MGLRQAERKRINDLYRITPFNPMPTPASTAAARRKPRVTKAPTKAAPIEAALAESAKVSPKAPPTSKTEAAAKPAAAHKAAKKSAKLRVKLVRDSFAMPESDFAVIGTLKSTALGARRAVKKSELLRAGLRMLATLDATSLVAAIDRLEPVKTGRPKKNS